MSNTSSTKSRGGVFMNLLKNLLYYVVVAFLVIYIFLMALSPERMIDLLGFRTFIVLSNSMEPVIKVDDLIISKRITEEELKEGDIVTFEVYLPELESTSYVTHYIGKIEETDDGTIYRTRGINLPEGTYDGWVDENGDPYYIRFTDIEGQYVFRVPYFGYIQKGLTNPIIVGLLLVNGGIIYLLYKYLKGPEEEELEESDE